MTALRIEIIEVDNALGFIIPDLLLNELDLHEGDIIQLEPLNSGFSMSKKQS